MDWTAVRFNEQWIGQWSEPNFDVVSVEEFDEPGVFLIHLNLRGVGRASGVGVEMDLFELVRIRDGLVWHNTFFRDGAEALEAARAPHKVPASPYLNRGLPSSHGGE